MNPPEASSTPLSKSSWFPKVNIWHLNVLVLFTVIAIKNIQDQRMTEPALVALAGVGFLGYALIGWAGWHASRRLEPKIGRPWRLLIYWLAMSGLFMLATVIYLVLEYRFRNG